MSWEAVLCVTTVNLSHFLVLSIMQCRNLKLKLVVEEFLKANTDIFAMFVFNIQ